MLRIVGRSAATGRDASAASRYSRRETGCPRLTTRRPSIHRVATRPYCPPWARLGSRQRTIRRRDSAFGCPTGRPTAPRKLMVFAPSPAVKHSGTGTVQQLEHLKLDFGPAPRNKNPRLARLRPGVLKWRGQDSNLRPRGYEPRELPGCSTPRHVMGLRRLSPTHNLILAIIGPGSRGD